MSKKRTANAAQPLAAVIDAIGSRPFDGVTLAWLERLLPVGAWAAYRARRDAPTTLHVSASRSAAGVLRGSPDADDFAAPEIDFDETLRHCRNGLCIFLPPAVCRPSGTPVRETRQDAPARSRQLCAARLQDDGSLLVVELHHAAPAARFDRADASSFAEIAPALLACVSRHIEWLGSEPRAIRMLLAQGCSQLTSRELDVLERLLLGMTYDGIAADIGLSINTVKTYRARAFKKLNIHFKNELFARMIRYGGHLLG